MMSLFAQERKWYGSGKTCNRFRYSNNNVDYI